MLGAISRAMILKPRRPLRRAMSTNSRETSENVCARTARAAHGHDVDPDEQRLGQEAAELQVGGDR